MRKIAANYLFPVASKPLKNGILILNDNNEVLDVIDTNGALKEQSSIEFYNGILVPGFVNAHCHLELSHLRSRLSGHNGLVSFIGQVQGMRSEGKEMIEDATVQADFMMAQNGIVAVGDISNSADSFNIKKKSHIYYHTFFEVFGLDERKAEAAINVVTKLREEAARIGLPCSVTPHATYSLSEKLFSLLADIMKNQSLLSVHTLEGSDEKSFFSDQKGSLYDAFSRIGLKDLKKKHPLDYIMQFLPAAIPTMFVHNTYANDADIDKICNHFQKPYFVCCPKSNLFIENRLPDLELWRKRNISLALGTDSLSSNDSLSILDEMKVLQDHFPSIPLSELIEYATLGGASALQIGDRFGSFEKGKKPGVNLITRIDFERMRLTAESAVESLVTF